MSPVISVPFGKYSRSSPLDFRCLRSAGPKDCGSGRAREIDSTQGINGCAQGLTGVHQVIYQADRGSRRESLACEATIAHPHTVNDAHYGTPTACQIRRLEPMSHKRSES